jgi:hypothetical protein
MAYTHSHISRWERGRIYGLQSSNRSFLPFRLRNFRSQICGTIVKDYKYDSEYLSPLTYTGCEVTYSGFLKIRTEI